MRALILALLLAVPAAVLASASVEEGRKLVQASKCEACHQRKVPGPPGTIYLRKDRKVTSREKLKAQVAVCNSELNLGLFPEDEEHVVAFLDATWYRLSPK